MGQHDDDICIRQQCDMINDVPYHLGCIGYAILYMINSALYNHGMYGMHGV